MKYAKTILIATFAAGAVFTVSAQKKLAPVLDDGGKTADVKAVAVEPVKADIKKVEAKKADVKATAKKVEAKKADAKAVAKKVEEKKAEVKEAKPVPPPVPVVAEEGKIVVETAAPVACGTDESTEPRGKIVVETAAPVAAAADAEKETKPVVYKTSKLIRRVIVTANSDISNALVESLRKDMKIPYIMIIDGKDQPDAATRVAFFPPRAEEPLMLTAKDLSKLLAYLRPEDVIFLGSADLLPDFYTKAVTGRTRVLRVNDSDWTKNAYKLSHILNSAKPAKAYQDHIARRKAEQEKRQAAYDAAVKAAQDADAKARQLEGELIKSVK